MSVEFPYKIVDKKRKPGLKIKAPITKVQLVKASEIFKDKAKDPEQSLYAIYGRVADREMRIATFSKPPKKFRQKVDSRNSSNTTSGPGRHVVTDDKFALVPHTKNLQPSTPFH